MLIILAIRVRAVDYIIRSNYSLLERSAKNQNVR